METFVCSRCNKTKNVNKVGGSGYATNKEGEKICYECCGEQDRNELLNLGKGKQLLLYWNQRTEEVTNWPGSFAIHANYYQLSKHFVPGKGHVPRTNIWFHFKGQEYYAYQIGYDNNVCYVRRNFGRQPKKHS